MSEFGFSGDGDDLVEAERTIGLAQTVDEEGTDPVPGLDLFDKDVERTRKGWSQLHISAGFMYMDADGSFSARLPDGNSVTIFDFDRAGLQETDSSYWLSVNWRSARSRWGMWFGSWRYDVIGSRQQANSKNTVYNSPHRKSRKKRQQNDDRS